MLFWSLLQQVYKHQTLIHRLVSFKALWSCTETFIWTFICPLYGENPRMFSSKT